MPLLFFVLEPLKCAGLCAYFTHSNTIDTKIWTCLNARKLYGNFVIFSEFLLDKWQYP